MGQDKHQQGGQPGPNYEEVNN